VDLYGTGQADAYFQAVVKVIGEELLAELISVYLNIQPNPDYSRQELLQRELFGHEKLGPIARNIIKLWYFGIWTQLPYAWSQSYGVLVNDVTFVINTSSYAEGLLWRAIKANPPGAKAPGFGSWAYPN
jgi:hypothetical protein